LTYNAHKLLLVEPLHWKTKLRGKGVVVLVLLPSPEAWDFAEQNCCLSILGGRGRHSLD